VLVGARGAGVTGSPAVLAAALSAVCLAIVANAFNDYEDRAIDALVHPDRPLPSGALTSRAALRTVAIAAVGGVAFGALAALPLGALSVGVIVLMLGYGRIKARSGVTANAIVAVLASLPFLYGAWAAGKPAAAIALVAIGFPIHFAREIAKDIGDVDGDRLRRRTLPIVGGVSLARTIEALVATIFIAAWVAFMGVQWFAIPALVLAVIAAYRSAPSAYKAAMALAMIAYYVSRP
jgi:geranylgeranylglycerol-phosphate geranylgeranyltransferase